MDDAREILRRHNVEVDATDHRSLDEIARALGLMATLAVPEPRIETPNDTAEERKARRPYFAN